ncbi:sugar ABC transporter substrate-binding protein [Paenibacillus sp. FJAT-27812]|uniref:sugar ABC transporter substrate-binding protein n=1 Tax=Paenibacillus sp. FJAT-27812 TaxID=1684143 RepID=UPI0006A78F53|nr:extracellular solute-binding protein [Paenibacillus sp. FJAT-27812]
MTELVIWHEFDGQGDTSIEVLEQLCEKFEEQHGVHIRLESMSITELGERIKHIHRTGEGPHMAIVPSDMASYKESALLSAVPLAWYEGIIGEHVLQSMLVDGYQAGLPILTGNHLALYYNRGLYKNPPLDWQEWSERSAELNDKGITPVGIDIKQSYSFIPLLTAFGGWPMHNNKPSLGTPEMEAAIAYVHNQREKGVLKSFDGATELLEQFLAGQISAIITGEWIYNYLQREMGDELGVAHLPAIAGKASFSMSSSIGLIFPNDSINTSLGDDIRKFAAFLLEDESQLAWAERAQRIPVRTGAMEKLQATADPNRQNLIAMANASRPIPVSPFMIAAWVGMEAGLAELEQGNAEGACRKMVGVSEEVVAQIEQFLLEKKEEDERNESNRVQPSVH